MDETQQAQRTAQEALAEAQAGQNQALMPYERQTARDIRQWAISQAMTREVDADKILETAKRYAAFVETGA